MIDDTLLKSVLNRARWQAGEWAELFSEATESTVVLIEDAQVRHCITGTETGAGLRLLDGFDTAYGYTNDLSASSLQNLAASLSGAATNGAFDKDIALKRQAAKTAKQAMSATYSLTEKTTFCQLLEKQTRALDPLIVQVRVRFAEVLRKTFIGNTEGHLTTQEKALVSLVLEVTVSQNQEIASGLETIGCLGNFSTLKNFDLHALAQKAVRRAKQNLTARQAPGGVQTVVLAGEAGGTLIHEAVGHGLEADLACEGLSVFGGKLGQQVASPLVTVIDDGTLRDKRGSFAFDDEGQESARNVLIKDGVLKSYMVDRLSAAKHGLSPTGNGRRESYEYRPIVRMTNTFVEAGKDDPASILRSVDRGLYVVKMGGGQVNTVNGDFVFGVTEAYLIENGKIGEPVKGATLVGNGPAVIQSIDRVGNDVGFSHGQCGKNGQGVPVTHAIPTLRVPELIVGGKV
jgi:TldD protein